MKRKNRKNSKRPKGFSNQLVAEKKKIAMALCLMSVMALMWIRVFTRQSPESAVAETSSETVTSELSEPTIQLSFIELPNESGRHDVISRDFFSSDNWRYFIERQRKRNGIEEINIVSTDGNKEVFEKLAEKLKLEGIMLTEKPRAYINGEVKEVGEVLKIRERQTTYECEVITIENNTVVIKCMDAEIILKLVKETTANND